MAVEEKRIRLRSDTAANWVINGSEVPASGEVCIEFGATTADTKFKIGDGTTTFALLPYFAGGGGGEAADIAFDPGGTIDSTNVQGAVEEVKDDAASALSSHAAILAILNGHLPAPSTAGNVLTVSGGQWTSLPPSGGTAESISVMLYNETISQYEIVTSNPDSAGIRWWVGPTEPVNTTGPFADSWAENDFYTNVAA